MAYYFYGDDTHAAREAIAKIAQEQSASIRWLDRDDLRDESSVDVLTRGSRSLFGREMLVVLDPSRLALGLQEEIYQRFNQASSELNVFWERGPLNKQSALIRQHQSQLRQFSLPDPATLAAWVIEQAIKRQGEITPEAARLLVERVGLNKWQLITELEKILLTKSVITVADINAFLVDVPEVEIFSVLDGLTKGDKAHALQGIQTLLNEGASEFYILSMLAYQFRTLLIIRSGQDSGQKPFDIVKAAKIKTYSVQKNWGFAAKKPAAYWRDALTRILAADFSIRQGKIDARTAVLMLIIGLV